MQTSSLTRGRVSVLDEAKAFIPTALTMLRIMLVSFVITALFFGEKQDAFLFFAVAEATDFFDGRLARRWKVTSEFGPLLDTIADKALHLPLFFYFLVWPRPDLPHLFLYQNI